MSKRIFLDVGANTGQTLQAVLDPVFRFDEIVCFEPVKSFRKYLAALADARVKIEPFGLWNKTCEEMIFNPETKGASLWHKDNARDSGTSERCKFVCASDWFAKNLRYDDTVFLKLNVEGAECDILDDLLDSCEFEKVTYAMIDFDVRKIASQKHREAEVRTRLAAAGLTFPRVAGTKQVMFGATHQDRIKSWLRIVESAQSVTT